MPTDGAQPSLYVWMAISVIPTYRYWGWGCTFGRELVMGSKWSPTLAALAVLYPAQAPFLCYLVLRVLAHILQVHPYIFGGRWVL
jgi:hypothetical protein